jgi:bile acid:Na+ symporter, BASS family
LSLDQALVFAVSVLAGASTGLSSQATKGQGEAESRRQEKLVLFVNLVVFPAIAWFFIRIVDIGNARVGILVAAAAPGGSTGLLFSAAAGGDARVATGYFLRFTTFGTVLAILLTAFMSPNGLPGMIRASALVAFASLLPLWLGQWFGRRFPKVAHPIGVALSRVSLFLLMTTIGVLVARHVESASLSCVGIGLLLSTGILGLSWLLPGDSRSRIAIGQVSAIRNVTLALLVLNSLASPPEAKLGLLSYGFGMYLGCGALALWMRYATAK